IIGIFVIASFVAVFLTEAIALGISATTGDQLKHLDGVQTQLQANGSRACNDIGANFKAHLALSATPNGLRLHHLLALGIKDDRLAGPFLLVLGNSRRLHGELEDDIASGLLGLLV